jgi:hypothetical protein
MILLKKILIKKKQIFLIMLLLLLFLSYLFLIFNTYFRINTNCYIQPEPIVYRNKTLCYLVFGKWREKGEYYEYGGKTTVTQEHCETKVFFQGMICEW